MRRVIFKAENLFLIFCLFWGLVFLIVSPPFQAPDELGHFYKMWGYTQGTLRCQVKDGCEGKYVPKSIAEIFGFYSKYVYSTEKIPLLETVKYSKMELQKDNKVFFKFGSTSYTPLSYFPSFLVLWVMKFLNAKPLLMMYILRFCSLLVYLALTYWAIKITPCKKWMFWFFALLPINVYQAAAISTDGITFGFILLFAAYTLKLAFDDNIKKIDKKHIIVWDILITCIAILKFAYFPIVLLYFIIPKTKFDTENLYFLNFIILAIFNAVVIALFLTGIMNGQHLTANCPENPLSTTISSSYMLKKILSAPVEYLKLVIKSTIFLKEFFYYNVVSSVGGNLVMVPAFASHLTWFLLILSVFYREHSEDFNLTWQNKSFIVALIVLSHLLIMTSVYLIYQTQPYIVGIQGRYLTPLLLFFLLLFNFKKIFIQNKIIPLVLGLISQFLLLMTFIIIIVYYY